MATTKKKAVAKKTEVNNIEKLLTPADLATKKVNSAVADLVKASEVLYDLNNNLDTVTQALAAKQEELTNIEKQVESAQRDAKAELAIRIKEDEDALFNELRRDRGIANISENELSVLRSELSQAADNAKKDLNKAVAVEVSKAKRDLEAQARDLELSHKAEIASDKAQIESLTGKISFLETHIDNLNETAEKERQARVKIAEHDSNKSMAVNVSGSGK